MGASGAGRVWNGLADGQRGVTGLTDSLPSIRQLATRCQARQSADQTEDKLDNLIDVFKSGEGRKGPNRPGHSFD
jgi:hypothetical protein